MATIIMISNDSSVIFNAGDKTSSNKDKDPLKAEDDDEDEGVGNDQEETNSFSTSSNSTSSPNLATPDASFLTPRPNNKNGSAKKPNRGRRRYNNSVSTVESDSEEHITNSSSSAASTLSSDPGQLFLTALDNLSPTSTTSNPSSARRAQSFNQGISYSNRACSVVVTSTPKSTNGLKLYVESDLNTRSLGRRRQRLRKTLPPGDSTIEEEDDSNSGPSQLAINTIGLPDYCTLRRSSRRRKPKDDGKRSDFEASRNLESDEVTGLSQQPPSFSIYSDMNEFQDLLGESVRRLRRAAANEKNLKKNFWTDEDDTDEVEEPDDDDVTLLTSEDNDFDDGSSSVLVAAAGTGNPVLPTGCHRHPHHVSLPPLSPRDDDFGDGYLRSLLNEDSSATSWRFSSPADHMATLNVSGHLSLMSLPVRGTDSSKETAYNTTDRVKRKKDRSSKILNGLSNKILRRHTTYVKRSGDANVTPRVTPQPQEQQQQVHVHSWHRRKQESNRRSRRQKVGGFFFQKGPFSIKESKTNEVVGGALFW